MEAFHAYLLAGHELQGPVRAEVQHCICLQHMTGTYPGSPHDQDALRMQTPARTCAKQASMGLTKIMPMLHSYARWSSCQGEISDAEGSRGRHLYVQDLPWIVTPRRLTLIVSFIERVSNRAHLEDVLQVGVVRREAVVRAGRPAEQEAHGVALVAERWLDADEDVAELLAEHQQLLPVAVQVACAVLAGRSALNLTYCLFATGTTTKYT